MKTVTSSDRLFIYALSLSICLCIDSSPVYAQLNLSTGTATTSDTSGQLGGPQSGTGAATNSSVFSSYGTALNVNSTSVGYGSSAGSANQSGGTNSDFASAYGYQAQAPGDGDVAMGYKASTFVGGLNSTPVTSPTGTFNVLDTAIGDSANASGGFATALGAVSTASGVNSVAVGVNSSATANSSTAIGNAASATATNSAAFGNGTSATGANSTALGNSASATGPSSFAAGDQATASLGFSTATGYFSSASSLNSSSYGANSNAVNISSSAYGASSNASGINSSAFGKSSSALGGNSSAYGNSSSASGTSSVAIGDTSSASAMKSLALGANSSAVNANDVALGAGSVTAAPNTGTFALYGGTAAGTASSVVSVGVAGTTQRQIQNVAPGVISATSTDAINGSQLYSVATGINSLGMSIATTFGGGATYSSTTGQISGASFTVGGTSYSNVGSAIAALNTATTSSAYFTANSSGAAASATGTNAIATGQGAVASGAQSLASGVNATASTTDATAVGNGATASGLNSAAFGNLSTASQAGGLALGNNSNATNANDVALGSNSTSSAPSTGPFALFGGSSAGTGTSVVSIGTTANGGQRQIQNVAAGSLTATSTDAVNGSQLYSLATTGTEYFHANSSLTDSSATGVNSIAVGPLATASGVNSEALGNGATASNAGSVALGSGAQTAAPSTLTSTSLYGSNFAGLNASSVVSVGDTGANDQRQISNVGAGNVTATSTDAINGSQLYAVASGVNSLGTAAATDFGGGATYNTTTGALSNPSYLVAGTSYTNVGAAIDALDAAITTGNPYLAVNSTLPAATATGANAISLGPNAVASGSNAAALGNGATASGANALGFGTGASASGLNAAAFGSNSSATGSNSLALGANSVASGANSVALGAGSVATAANTVSVGSPGNLRTISNLAPGVNPTDAVNVQQLTTSSINTLNSANAYTNKVSNIVLNSANSYTNQVGSQVLGQANAYSNQVGSQTLLQGEAYTNVSAQQLRNQISQVSATANEGVAAAVAMLTSMKTPNPGKSIISIGSGYYGGQAGMALSMSHRSRDSKWHSAAALGVPATISNGQNIAAAGSIGWEF